MLFLISYQLCKEFPALSPFAVDEQPYSNVIKLYGNVIDIHIDRKVKQDPARVEVVRRRAGDDWF